MEKNEVIKSLVENGAKFTKDLRVRSVTVSHIDDGNSSTGYDRVSFYLADKVDGYVVNKETGAFEKGQTNFVWIMGNDLLDLLRETDAVAIISNLKYAKDSLMATPNSLKEEALNTLLCDAKISVVTEEIVATTDKPFTYKNPFYENRSEKVFDHSTFINTAVKLTLGKVGQRIVDKTIDANFAKL